MSIELGRLESLVGIHYFDAQRILQSMDCSVDTISYGESSQPRLTVLSVKAHPEDPRRVSLELAGQNPIKHLPSQYQENHSLRQFLWVFQHINYHLTTILDSRHRYFTPMHSPREFTAWMASWFGIVDSSRLEDHVIRKYVQFALPLYRWRGTSRGLRGLLGIVAGLEPQIYENTMPYGPYTISGNTADAHILNAGTASSYFVVHFPLTQKEMGFTKVQQIGLLVAEEKPAHTECFITYVPDDNGQRGVTQIDETTAIDHLHGMRI